MTFGDVTGLRRAEEQIRRLAAAATQSNDAVILFDLQGKVQAWNHGAQHMYGWSETEALRMNVRDFVPADKMAESLDLMRRLAAGEAVASFETQRLTKDRRVLESGCRHAGAERDRKGRGFRRHRARHHRAKAGGEGNEVAQRNTGAARCGPHGEAELAPGNSAS